MTETIETEKTDLTTLLTQDDMVNAFMDAAKADALVERLTAVTILAEDVTTLEGRKIIGKTGRDLAGVKNRVEETRLGLTKNLREQVAEINKHGGSIVERLQALQDKIEAPLKEWKANETTRLQVVDGFFDRVGKVDQVNITDTADDLAIRLKNLEGFIIRKEIFDDRFQEATDAKRGAVIRLTQIVAKVRQSEADATELARHRAADEERQRIEVERLAAAQTEQDRIERERVAQEQSLAQVEAARVQAEKDAADRLARELAAAEERRLADIARLQAEQAAETERLAQIERDRAAEVDRQAAADLARQQDEEHRASVIGDVSTALDVRISRHLADMPMGTQITGNDIVEWIVAGQIPHTSIAF